MLVGNRMSLGCLWLGTSIPSMNLANKSCQGGNQLHNNIMSVSDGRLHATTSVYSTRLGLY